MTESNPKRKSITKIAFIGTYKPRQCGIATFTASLCNAVASEARHATCYAAAINDRPEGYAYPERVRFEFSQNDLATYTRAADFLNISNPNVVCIQHEFGIFGGPAGNHVYSLLRSLHIPIVTTLHTILKEPDDDQITVMSKLIDLSDCLVSMSHQGIEFLKDIYKAPEDKLAFIPHGIPDFPFVEPNYYKDQFAVAGRPVILTFGLLGPSKGIEYMIEALPKIIAKHPDVVYFVVGATHPHVLRHAGENYRLSLRRRVRDLGLEDNVIFYNRFVDDKELSEFIGSADIYVTPYVNEEQITSGTLAFSLGAGRAVVSTPYRYARELLDEGRGLLVPFKNPDALAEKIIWLLDNEMERLAMRKRAYEFARQMVWREVARRYLDVFVQVRERRSTMPSPSLPQKVTTRKQFELPPLKLSHMRRMTDSCGMLQHAKYTVPDLVEGYTTDDNARALMVAALAYRNGSDAPNLMDLASGYLAFLRYAFNNNTARFRNFLSYERKWTEATGSEDSHGRALMGLGTTVAYVSEDGLRSLAASLFERAISSLETFSSPRAWAFALLGIQEYLRLFGGDMEIRRIRESLAKRLLDCFKKSSSKNWPWPEEELTYANASLPHALIMSGKWMQHGKMVETGLKTLRWLVKTQTSRKGNFSPVGNHGFMKRGGKMARFDQQPIEAQTTVSACLEARRVTGDVKWIEHARRIFEWFLGRNDLGLAVYDFKTGGCHDGLHPDRLNLNQGAESTLAWLLALLEMQQAEIEF